MESNGLKFVDTEYILLLGELEKFISPNRPLLRFILHTPRCVGFIQWMKDNPGVSILPVTLSSSRKFYIEDGFHRIAVCTSLGIERMAVRFNNEESLKFFLEKGIVVKA